MSEFNGGKDTFSEKVECKPVKKITISAPRWKWWAGGAGAGGGCFGLGWFAKWKSMNQVVETTPQEGM